LPVSKAYFGFVIIALIPFAVTLEENTPEPETFKIPPLSLNILFPSVLVP
jgi:hypothetical protein